MNKVDANRPPYINFSSRSTNRQLNMATSNEGVRYAGKVTIVTGGAQGIGRGCVEVFGNLRFSFFLLS